MLLWLRLVTIAIQVILEKWRINLHVVVESRLWRWSVLRELQRPMHMLRREGCGYILVWLDNLVVTIIATCQEFAISLIKIVLLCAILFYHLVDADVKCVEILIDICRPLHHVQSLVTVLLFIWSAKHLVALYVSLKIK